VCKPRDNDSMVQNNEGFKTNNQRATKWLQQRTMYFSKWQKSELDSSKEFLATHLRGLECNEKVGCCDALLNLLKLALRPRQLNEKGH
jgi:hypothetical protein